MLVNYIWASLAYQIGTMFSENVLSEYFGMYQKHFLSDYLGNWMLNFDILK